MTDRNIIIMANEVSALMKTGFDYKSAIRQVLRLHQITNDWSVYFSKIGKALHKKEAIPGAMPNEKLTSNRVPAQLNLFTQKFPS